MELSTLTSSRRSQKEGKFNIWLVFTNQRLILIKGEVCMKKNLSSIFIIITALFLLVACSNDGNNNMNENNNDEEVNNEEINDDLNNDDEDNNTEDSASTSEKIENQTELSFSETGTLITGDISENFRVEIKPESVEYTDEYEDEIGKEEPWEEIFVKYTAKIKNTDDKAFPISKIRVPSLATWENEEDDFRTLS